MHPRRQLLASAGGLLAGLAGLPAFAQAPFPSRAVTLVVPHPAGSPSDSNARRVQPYLQKSLGQPVVVENVSGAGGTLGVGRALQQPADGHAVLVGTPTELVLSALTIPGVRYRPEDFAMFGNFGLVPYVLCCRAGLPQATLGELLALAGRGGAPLNIGHIGPGSMIQLLSLEFERISGLGLNHVPYRGVPPMMQDAMAGQLDLCFLPLAGSVAAQIDPSRLRTLAVTSPGPSRVMPQVPTMASLDPRFARFVHEVWGGLFVRAETPEPVQARLHAWWSETARDPELLAWLRSSGGDPLPVLPLADLRQFYSREVARYHALLKSFPESLLRS